MVSGTACHNAGDVNSHGLTNVLQAYVGINTVIHIRILHELKKGFQVAVDMNAVSAIHV